ncbi:HECT domain-containing family protein [Reticulomyxa filosa]|uniref:HECT domain-containing family protein n=1 Tax=Reticulomyxa filosa TaxID=46433 RepID=X6MCJ2_RETFI|nr:HECT domain-containing family protein [Reticulomyxa filosa]|eukprot:ETO11738.1 HECT domain-containing family protein [Reticulomyxa filosa]
MGDAVLGDSAKLIAEQLFFVSDRFLDFAEKMSSDNTSELYNYYFQSTIVKPTIDGIFDLVNNNGIVHVDGIVIENTSIIACNGNLSQGLSCQEYRNNGAQLKSSLANILNDIWSYSQKSKNGTRLYWFNDIQLRGRSPSIWISRFRYYEEQNRTTVVVMRSSQIDAKYHSLDLHFDAVVYWVSDDDYADVFVSSTYEQGYQISSHSSENSNISLNSSGTTFSDNHEDANKTSYSKAIAQTIGDFKSRRKYLDKTSGQLHYDQQYSMYTRRVNLGKGLCFWCVIVYPLDAVNQNANNAFSVVVVLTGLGCLLAIIVGFVGQAVPVIPSDERYRLHPFFATIYEETGNKGPDAAIVKDIMVKAKQQKDQLLSQIRDLRYTRTIDKNDMASVNPNSYAVQQQVELVSLQKSATDGDNNINGDASDKNKDNANANANANDADEKNTGGNVSSNKTTPRRHSIGSTHPSELDKKKIEVLQNMEEQPRLNLLLDLNDRNEKEKEYEFDDDEYNTNDDNHNSKKRNDDNDDDNNNDDDNDDDDDDDEDVTSGEVLLTGPQLAKAIKKEESTATEEQGPMLRRARTADVMAAKQRVDKMSAKQVRQHIRNWKKEEQKKHLQSNIKRQLMRSIFNRELSQWQTKWGVYASRAQTILAILVLVCIGLSYTGCRSLASNAIKEMRQNYMSIATSIGELGMEYEYLKGRLMLQNFKKMYVANKTDNSDLFTFWESYKVLGVVRVENTTSYKFTQGYAFANDTNLQLSTGVSNDKCLWWKVSSTNSKIRDCVTFKATFELIDYFTDKEVMVAWSKPYSCFRGATVCYLGLYKISSTNFIGVLLSFRNVSNIVHDHIWNPSKLATLQKLHRPNKTVTMSYLNFSLFAMTNARCNCRYYNISNSPKWYLIETTSQT